MGYDTLVDGDRAAQVKLWDCEQYHTYQVGDSTPQFFGEGYSIGLREGGWANIERDGKFLGIADQPMFGRQVDKYGCDWSPEAYGANDPFSAANLLSRIRANEPDR
jgi:hypothetical protein